MSEHDFEPIRGLPGHLPAGEHILWQGAPDRALFLRSALHSRWLAGYFAVLAMAALANGNATGALVIIGTGLVLHGLLAVFALLVARTTVYTITNRRVVLRIGVALSKCINLPLALMTSADMRSHGQGGDIALTFSGKHRLGYAVLWPHARPFHFADPKPMLRALPDAAAVADILARACGAVPARHADAVAPALAGAEALREATA